MVLINNNVLTRLAIRLVAVLWAICIAMTLCVGITESWIDALQSVYLAGFVALSVFLSFFVGKVEIRMIEVKIDKHGNVVP